MISGALLAWRTSGPGIRRILLSEVELVAAYDATKHPTSPCHCRCDNADLKCLEVRRLGLILIESTLPRNITLNRLSLSSLAACRPTHLVLHCQMRLAKEAFNIPVYAVLQASTHHRTRTLSPSGASGSNGAPGNRGPTLRGRGHSPAAGSRSPVGRGRSTPSSPDHERGGDRPHRRTRRGGRRGRNR